MIITTLDNYCQSFIVACTLKNVEKEAVLYERLPNHKVRCLACARYCEIGKDQIGLCGIRGNKEGKLVLFVYGKVAACHIDPIEKKRIWVEAVKFSMKELVKRVFFNGFKGFEYT